MPRFQIEYAKETPPAAGPSVRANLNMDTGAGAVWEQVARAGGQLASMGLEIMGKIQDAKDSNEYDTAVRKEGELWNIFNEHLPGIQDPEARREAYAAYVESRNTISSQRPNVQRAIQHHLSLLSVQRQAEFNGYNLQATAKEVGDEFKFNLEANYQTRDRDTFEKLLEKGSRLGLMTPAQRQYYSDNFDFNADLTQMQQLAGRRDPDSLQAAISIGEKYEKEVVPVKGVKEKLRVDAKIRSAINQLANEVRREQKELTRENVTNLTLELDKARTISSDVARSRTVDALMAQSESSLRSLTPEQVRAVGDDALAAKLGYQTFSDPMALADIDRIVRRVKVGDSTQAAEQQIYNLRFRVSTEHFSAAMREVRDAAESRVPTVANERLGTWEERGAIPKSEVAAIRRATLAEIKLMKTPPTDEQIGELVDRHVGGWPRKGPFSEEYISKGLGALQNGGYFSVQTGLVEFANAQEAMLWTATYFGDFWMLTDAAEIIKAKYPGVTIPKPPVYKSGRQAFAATTQPAGTLERNTKTGQMRRVIVENGKMRVVNE